MTSLQALQTDGGDDLQPDVNMVVTTTDLGQSGVRALPEPRAGTRRPGGDSVHEPPRALTSLSGTQVDTEACTDVCPNDAAPIDGAAFVHCDAGGDNIADVDLVDIDGDGLMDAATSQALACLLPQGLDGCGYEQPLENSIQALNPSAPWTNGMQPFSGPTRPWRWWL